jgi:hypothetical protein
MAKVPGLRRPIEMIDRDWTGVSDKHMNLFYTYRTKHLEDNVTRALVLVFRNLAPAHLRLFFHEVVLRAPAQRDMREHMSLLAEDKFEFELQVTPPEESSERLDASNGVIVGVNYSGTQAPVFDASIENLGGARPDALIADTANNITAIFEIKLDDSLYKEQIQRHFKAFFAPTTKVEQVFVEIKWSEIADFLSRVQRQSVNDRERFVVSAFIEYLDWLNLIEFSGFNASDFRIQQYNKLHRFLALVTGKLDSELGLEKYSYNGMLRFQDIPHENVWVEMAKEGISCGIVCGSGKMWRAQRLRDYIASDPSAFKEMLERLRKSLDPQCEVVLRVHSYFRYSRFRTAWLPNIGGEQPYPRGFQKFVSTLTDRNLNAFEYVSKTVIQQRFSAEIEEGRLWHGIEVGEDGQFPKWKDIDKFLQYAYFLVDVLIPSEMLIRKPLDDLIAVMKSVLGPEHEMMRAMNAAV